MQKIAYLIITTSFLMLFPFLLFLVVFSANQNGDTSEFEPTTPQEQVALAVAQFVLEQGGTKEFAVAWIGNMEHESGLIPSRIQSDLPFNDLWAYNPKIGGYGIGLAQWDSGRRVNLLDLAKKENMEWQSIELQLNYAWNHDSSDSELLKNMANGTSIDGLAVDILNYWERAGTKDDLLEQTKRKISANQWYKRLFEGSLGNGSTNVGGGKIDLLEAVMGQTINGGQCYGLTAYYVQKLGGPVMMGSGFMYAESIGRDYNWEKYGWEVVFDPKPSEIKAGDVINWYAGQALSPGVYGHTGIIASVESEKSFTTYEQNAEQGQICARYSRTWGKEFTRIASVVRKK